MNILVINGSPRGLKSVTYHHVLFIEKHFKSCTFDYVHIGLLYKKLNQKEYVEKIVNQMKNADGVFFIYPVYTFSIPYQLMLFMKKLYAYKGEFDGISAFQLSTSKHFYDVTAYNYMQMVLEDLGFNHLQGHMADMNDLLNDQGRKKLVSAFSKIEFNLELKTTIAPKYNLPVSQYYDYTHHMQGGKEKKQGKILVIYNGADYSTTLKHMINAFENYCPYQVHRLDLSNIMQKGGCIGCLKCTFTGHCVYKDDYEALYSEKIQDADILIYASDIEHHWLHSDFKYVHDRAFYNGHRIETSNSAVGYLLTGTLRGEPLRDVLEARASVGHMNLLGIVTNEDENIDSYIKNLAESVDFYIKNQPIAGDSFYSVGGFKIFRDLVYEMRALMREDHKFYKKNKLYDFPKAAYLKNFVIGLGIRFINHPKVFKKMSHKLDEGILLRYQNVIDKY